MTGDPINDSLDGAEPEPLDFHAVVAELARLEPFEYDRRREAAARDLSVRVGTLDDAVKAARASDVEGSTGQGRALQLPEIEPHPEPVDGAELLSELAAAVRRHIAMNAGMADTTALWTVMAHCFGQLDIAPRLNITSPEKQCGKSTTLDVVGCLVPRALPCSNIKPAAIFRVIEEARPTLIIDEADTFMREDDELRGVLNSGHSRAGAFVIRCVGDDHEPRQFSTWAAMVIAGIGKLPDTLRDRSVIVELRRKLPDEKVERLDRKARERLHELARKAARWARDHCRGIGDHEPELPAGVENRAADNWRPLLAIADLAGGEWPERARRALATLQGTREDDSIRVRLLRDIRDVFAAAGDPDDLRSQDLANALAAIEDSPWPEFSKGKPLTTTKLARLLKPFGIASRHTERGNVYRLQRFAEAWNRYLPPSQPFSPSGIQQTRGIPPIPTFHAGKTDEGLESGSNPHGSSIPEGLKGWSGGAGGKRPWKGRI